MSIWLGVGLALCSTACSATGYTLQKIAHNRHDKEVQDLKRAASQESGVTTSSEGVEVSGEPAPGKEGIVVSVRPPSPSVVKHNSDENEADAAPASPRADVKEIDISEVVQTTAKPKSYLMYWQFPVGLLLLVVGTLFAAFVFGLAPQSTLAPLGSVTMILNTILSWKFLGEAFTYIDAVSIGLMACGTTVAVLFGKSSDPKYTCVHGFQRACIDCVVFMRIRVASRLSSVVNLFVNRPAAWALASSAALAITAATAFVYTVGRKPIEEMRPGLRRVDVFCRAFLGAAWSGYSNFASKAVVEVAFSSVLNRSGADWQRPELYLLAFVMFASLIMQVRREGWRAFALQPLGIHRWFSAGEVPERWFGQV
jgi:hypothetical protein